MKKATYNVTTKNGKTYKWSFTESKNEGDYGNGIYIAVKMPSGDTFLIDCRYAPKYDFNRICVDFLLEWYGENFAQLYEADEEDLKND